MSLSSTDHKAIGWFCQHKNLKPQLSVPPAQMHFTERDTGKSIVEHLDMITALYGQFKHEEKLELKRAEKARLIAAKTRRVV